MATAEQLRTYLKRATVELAETRQRLADARECRDEPIAIIGMACRYPGGGDTLDGFWRLLSEGRSAVTEIPPSRWNVDDYYHPDRGVPGAMYTRHGAFLPDIAGWDAGFFGLSPQEALRMAPAQRLLLELAWEGLEDAGTAPTRLAGSRTGVLVGFMDTGQWSRLQLERLGESVVADPYFGQGATANVIAGRIAYQLDLRGPTMTIDTACSSSLTAVHLAAESLRRGDCDLAVAASASLNIHPDYFVYACATSMLCTDGRCKTFDARADGYVMGEGGGVVVLEPLSRAIAAGRRIRAVIRGSAINQDGRSNGLTAPNRAAQVDVITRALAAAQVAPGDLDYVEAHGSGTRLGDQIELSALHDVFGGRPPARPLHVGAVKTNLGHTQAAAGMAGLIKAVLLVEHGTVPPNLHLAEPAEAVPRDGTIRPAAETVPLPDRGRPALVGVSSFGWSGSNTHLVLQAAPPPERRQLPVRGDASAGGDAPEPPVAYALPVSAASPAALRAHLGNLAGWLAERPSLDLADVAHTLQTGRAGLDHRRVLVCGGGAAAVRQLAAAAVGDGGVRRLNGRPRVAFLLPGVGDQYQGMGLGLYASEPAYAGAVDRCVALVAERCGVDLGPLLTDRSRPPACDGAGVDLAGLIGRGPSRGEPEDDPLRHAEVAHPFLFTVQYALATLLARWGVQPDALVGYSLGEYVAACLAGVFSLSDALDVVVRRARLIATAPAGRMVAVAAGEDRVRDVLAGVAPACEVDIAALNGPGMTVLSGLPAGIEAATGRLLAAGIACRALRTAHAFHSSLLQPARDELAALLDSVPRQTPATTIVSNLTGAALTAEQATSAGYWAEHLVSPVRFADGVRHCLDRGIDVFVELGAGQTLGGLLRQSLTGERPTAVFGTLPAAWAAGRDGRRPDDRVELLGTAGRLWELGATVDWRAGRPPGRIVDLPGYPWQRTRFWPEPARARASSGPAPAAVGVVVAREASGPVVAEPAVHCYAPDWRRDTAGGPHQRSARGSALRLPGPLVVFSDAGGIGERLADLAAAGGVEVVEVVPGTQLRRDGRRLTIDPRRPEHYREAFAAGAHGPAHGPVHVVHLWSLLDPPPAPDQPGDVQLRAAIRNGFDSLLLAVQALGDLPAGRGVRLLTASRGAAEIIGADAPEPQRAIVHGLGRAVRHEYPGLTWHGVDLDPQDAPPAELATHLAHELRLTAAPPAPASPLGASPVECGRPGLHPAEVGTPTLQRDGAGTGAGAGAMAGWRRGRRWVKGWEAVATEGPASGDAGPWRADGAYLITGGTRGLGLALARHLVRHGVRKLALVGRTPLAAHRGQPADERAARSLRDVEELESTGARVLLLTADVGVPDELRAALRRCREHFGALHGVVHAAGVPAGGLLRRRTPAQTSAVLTPKVLAMGPLAELVGPGTPAHQRPEVLVLYSSAVTAFGGIGEGDYCAANTVLDVYGEALAVTAPSTRVLAVAWGPWQHDDWPAGARPNRPNRPGTASLAERVRAYRQRYGFADEAGCALLDRLLDRPAAAGHGSVLAIRQPLPDMVRDWSAMLDLDALVGAGSAVPRGERFPRPPLRTEFVAPRTELEATVAGAWGAFLGIDRVGVHDPFFDLGGNSLVGMAMVLAVEKELGVAIAPAVLFEHPTVAAFAAALERAGGDVGSADAALTTSSARGQRRRRARSGAGR